MFKGQAKKDYQREYMRDYMRKRRGLNKVLTEKIVGLNKSKLDPPGGSKGDTLSSLPTKLFPKYLSKEHQMR